MTWKISSFPPMMLKTSQEESEDGVDTFENKNSDCYDTLEDEINEETLKNIHVKDEDIIEEKSGDDEDTLEDENNLSKSCSAALPLDLVMYRYS